MIEKLRVRWNIPADGKGRRKEIFELSDALEDLEMGNIEPVFLESDFDLSIFQKGGKLSELLSEFLQSFQYLPEDAQNLKLRRKIWLEHYCSPPIWQNPEKQIKVVDVNPNDGWRSIDGRRRILQEGRTVSYESQFDDSYIHAIKQHAFFHIYERLLHGKLQATGIYVTDKTSPIRTDIEKSWWEDDLFYCAVSNSLSARGPHKIPRMRVQGSSFRSRRAALANHERWIQIELKPQKQGPDPRKDPGRPTEKALFKERIKTLLKGTPKWESKGTLAKHLLYWAEHEEKMAEIPTKRTIERHITEVLSEQGLTLMDIKSKK